MLDELSQYENLGTPGFFWELLGKIHRDSARWTTEDVRQHFSNRIVDGESIFDGCIPMGTTIGVIMVDGQGSISMNATFATFLVDERYLRGKIIERMLEALKEDGVFLGIFSPRYLSFDIVYHLIQIENSAFKFKYAGFRRFLISFGLLNPHPDPKIRKLIINPKHRRLFDKYVLTELRKRKIGIENLHAMLEQKQIAGADAEDFVVGFDRNRLTGHLRLGSVQRISDYDVAAGYDVVSFNDAHSSVHDRFIEVKSCSLDNRFYWSKNEVEQARIKRNQYFLYLVDPAKMKAQGYKPMIIQNPYENVFVDDSWTREAQTWLFSKK